MAARSLRRKVVARICPPEKSLDRVGMCWACVTRLTLTFIAAVTMIAGCASTAAWPSDPLTAERERLSTNRPSDPEPYLSLARQYIQRRDYDGARTVLLLLVGVRPDYARGHFLLGRLAIETEDWNEAIARLTRATEVSQNEADAWLALGAVHEHRREFDQAVQAYRDGFEANPDKDRLKQKLKALLARLGREAEMPVADPALPRLRAAFFAIDRNYIELPNFTVAGIGAMRALAALVSEMPIQPEALAADASASRASVVAALDVLFREARAAAPSRSPDDLETAMIDGAVQALDPYSSYRDHQETQAEASSNLAGVGLELTLRNGVLTVVAAIDGTPAFLAGLLPNDRIVRIDGSSTTGMRLHSAVSRLRGKAGSTVTLTILRSDWPEPKDFEIRREQIVPVSSVRAQDLGSGIAYIKLQQFQEVSPREMEIALEKFGKAGMRALILDLRHNPGGLLLAAVEITEQFLEDRKLLMYTEGRVRNQNMKFTAHAKKAYTSMPMVVLVNEGSVAASEIVAGALQDWGRATIVGTRSFGNGTIQTIISLYDGSSLRLTTARFVTPKGLSIHGKGITPDIVVEMPATKDTLSSTSRIEELKSDVQLQRAIDAIDPKRLE